MFIIEISSRPDVLKILSHITDHMIMSVDTYSHNAIGGPDKATIEFIGGDLNVLELLSHSIVIKSKYYDYIWGGYIETINLNYNGITLKASLDKLFNRVMVTFQEPVPQLDGAGLPTGNYNYVPATTDWSNDTVSQELFGVKENILGMGQAYPGDAIQKRDTFIFQSSFPRVDPTFGKKPYNIFSNTGTLECKGWYYTLDYEYYANDDKFTLDTFIQIKDILATNPYFNNIHLLENSGVETLVEKKSTTTKKKDIEDLIDIGTDTYSPVIMECDEGRNFTIRKASPELTNIYSQRADGTILDNNGQELDPILPLYGVWIDIIDLQAMPVGYNFSPLYISGSSYSKGQRSITSLTEEEIYFGEPVKG